MTPEPLDPAGPEYRRRFIARFKRSVAGLVRDDDAAYQAALEEYESLEVGKRTADPEADAEKSLSYWED